MERMAQWAVIIPAERWATERLFQHETLSLSVPSAAPVEGGRPAAGDDAVLITGDEQQAVALGRFTGEGEIAYIRRAFDEPVPVDDLKLTEQVTAVDVETFAGLAARLGETRPRRPWLVSVAMPIEAGSPAEAVRQFWSYVAELGPAELPAFVWPSGDELSMQAFVLGAEANQDPEEDEDDD
jgi:hypothetical protein